MVKIMMEERPSMKGHIEIADLLLEKGADINIRDNYGMTASMRAAKNGYTEIVRLLIEKRADINNKDNYGCTALVYLSNKTKDSDLLREEKNKYID